MSQSLHESAPAPAGLVPRGIASAPERPSAKFLPRDAANVLVVDTATRASAPGTVSDSDGVELLGAPVPGGYDAIVLDGALGRFRDLTALFGRARELLADENARLIVADVVEEPREWLRRVGGHAVRDIEREFHAAGFLLRRHERTDPPHQGTRHDVTWRRPGHPPRALSPSAAPPPNRPDHDLPGAQHHEIWDLRPDPVCVRDHRPGDEIAVIDAFREIFEVPRSLEHWQWKFENSPFGPRRASNAWDGDQLVGHYAGYVVPFWMDGKTVPALHAGDTMTRPSHRGHGRGKANVLARTLDHFERQHGWGDVVFGYGFTTGPHLRIGEMLLGYSRPAEVYVRTLEGDALRKLAAEPRPAIWRRRFTVLRAHRAGFWADLVFRRARRSLGWQVARTRQYLRWRYDDHPDFEHEYFVVHEWGVPCGWWLGRVNGDTLEVGDALFRSRSNGAARAGLAAALRAYRDDGVEIRKVTGWMSLTPEWWNQELNAVGFTTSPEPTGLELIVKSCVDDVAAEEFTRNIYFMAGDSDMY